MKNSDESISNEFELFDSFNFCYFTQKNDQFLFLLFKTGSNSYQHLEGVREDIDPGIIFSVARKASNLGKGLFTYRNLINFSADNRAANLNSDYIKTVKKDLSIPKLMASKVYQNFIEDIFESSIQNQSDREINYFIQIPEIDVPRFNKFCKVNRVDLQIEYKSQEDIKISDPENISESTQEFMTKNWPKYINKYFTGEEKLEIKKRFGVILIQTTPTNYRNLGIIGSLLKKPGELWKVYRFPLERPTDEELHSFDGIVIPGSNLCAHDKNCPVRDDLVALIKEIYLKYLNCKIMGICFGIQIIAEALGGKCQRMTQAVRGSSKIEFNDKFWDLPYHKGKIEKKSSHMLSKCHFDAVIEAPPMAIVLGSSTECPVEIFAIENRVFGFQGHPEINEAWLACLLYEWSQSTNDFQDYLAETKTKFFEESLDHEFWAKLIYNFLKSDF